LNYYVIVKCINTQFSKAIMPFMRIVDPMLPHHKPNKFFFLWSAHFIRGQISKNLYCTST